MRDNYEIFNLLRQDHEKVARLLEEIQNDDNSGTRAANFALARTELKVHSATEEEALYPRLRKYPAMKGLIEEAVEEHDEVDRLLGELDGREVGVPEWEESFEEMKDAVEHHIDEEEGELFSEMRRLLSESELRELAARFQESKQRFRHEYSTAA